LILCNCEVLYVSPQWSKAQHILGESMNKRQFLRIAGGGVIAAATLSSLSGCSTHPSECRKSLCATTARRYGIGLAHATLIAGFTGIS
jgi:hypothetical protein